MRAAKYLTPDPGRLAFALALGCAACGLAMFVYGLWRRPYAAVEAELVFEASRIQKGFPLYVDPFVGAWENGAPPSRYYVLYTPFWPWLLAHVSPHTPEGMRTVGRLANTLLLLTALGAAVRASQPANRLAVATGAALVLGFEMLVREATLADADMPAVFLSTLALLRMNARRGLDAASAVMLAATPLIKPSVLGGAVGAVVAHLAVHRRSGARRLLLPLAAGAAAGAGVVLVFHVASGGVWLRHIVRATGQTISLERWFQEFGARAAFLGAPHAIVLTLAVLRGSPLLATLPLATSTAWATFCMAKHGSGTQYWLEPTMAALVVMGTMPPSPSRRSMALSWGSLAFVAVAGAFSAHAFAATPARYQASRDELARLRASCPSFPVKSCWPAARTWSSRIDGRVIVPAWQTAYLIRTGTFPLQAWREDIARPEVRCLALGRDYLDPPPARIQGAIEVSAYRKELRDIVEKTFALQKPAKPAKPAEPAEGNDGLLVFRRR